MEAIECIKTRRSIRSFEKTAVSHELIAQIVEAASWAPSWKNTQTVRYIVVEDKQKIKLIAEECVLGFTFNSNTIKGAPAIVLVTSIKGRSGFERDGSYSTPKGDRWEMFDAGAAAQTFCLAAHEKGLGTVIMGIFDENKVSEAVDIPAGQQLSAMIAIGYPKGGASAPSRQSIDELLTFC